MYHGERFNSISHLVGLATALVAASVLITLAAITGDTWKIVSCSIYGAIMVFLFGFSTLYHSLQGRAKEIFRKLDYVAIYLMIAGTYTPFSLVPLRETSGWPVLLAVWTLAFLGIAQEVLRKSVNWKISLAIYLGMSLLILFSIQDLWRELSATALTWLLMGGAFYSAGIIFFWNDTKWKHAHGIWHLFVLGGCYSQYLSVILTILR